MKIKSKKKEAFSLTEGSLKWWDYVIFAAAALVCFFCFQQRDLLHTAGCSVGFINGHIRDFYDYCGTFDIHPSYMPTIYVLFAIWNIPMRLFGFLTVPTEDITLTAILWSKALPCIAYVLSGIIIYKICMEIGMGTRKSKYCVYACLSMPIAFFNQFIFGQYDIFMTACVLLGVLYYLKKKDIWFIFWFGAAVTFKYTAVVIFLPLLLLRCKNVWKIVGSVVLLVIPFALEFILFRHSAGFRNYTFGVGSSGDNPTGYIFNAGIYTGFQFSAIKYQVSLVVMVYGVILGLAYFTRPVNENEQIKWSFYLACLSFFALFGLAKWHPQWLLLAVPFWVISAFIHRDTKIFMIIDLLFMGFFVVFLVQTIPYNVDQSMINRGILGGLVDRHIGTRLTMADILGKLDAELCLSIISMIMLVYALFKHPKYCVGDFSEKTECMGWIRTRFLAGTAVFVLPAFLCLAVAMKTDLSGYQVSFEPNTVGVLDMSVPGSGSVNLDSLGSSVSQRFCAKTESLDQLHFTVIVNGRINSGYLKFTLLDAEDGRIMYEKDWQTASFVDGERIKVGFGGMPVEKDHYYEAKFEITQANGDYLISIPYREGFVTGDKQEYASIDGKKKDYQLAMIVYQK